MSFILDALKRAEAEREQGRVPGLMAQHGDPLSHPAQRHPDAPRAGLLWRTALLALAVLIAGLLLWLVFKPEALSPQAVAVTGSGAAGAGAGAADGMAAAPPPLPATAPPEAMPPPPSPAVPPMAPPTAPPVTTDVRPATAAQADSALAAAAEKASAAAASKQAFAQARAASAAEAKAAKLAAAQAAQAAATAPPEKLPSLADLPPELRAGVPALAVSGAIHSQNRADRLLIVNGVLLHEGESIAPGLVLEQIRLKSAVLRFKNQRFELAY